MTFRREGLWHHLAQCARETLTSHLPLKVIPHPGDLLSVLLQRQRSRPSLGVRHTEEASPWGWPGSSVIRKIQLSKPCAVSGGCWGPLVSKLMHHAQNNVVLVTSMFHKSIPSAKVTSELDRK